MKIPNEKRLAAASLILGVIAAFATPILILTGLVRDFAYTIMHNFFDGMRFIGAILGIAIFIILTVLPLAGCVLGIMAFLKALKSKSTAVMISAALGTVINVMFGLLYFLWFLYALVRA